jgi:aminoglycoside phosphotransferase
VRRAALAALETLRRAHEAGACPLSWAERSWLKRLSEQAEQLPDDEGRFINETLGTINRHKVRLGQYELTP